MDFSPVVEAVGWPWLLIMLIFFAFTVWWGFGGQRNQDPDDHDDA